VSETENMLKEKRFSDVEDIESSVKQFLTDIHVQDFKNYFEQWPKHWEFEGDYFEKL
jgi:hypothetical protein